MSTPLKASSLADIVANALRDKEIYEKLSADDRAEVDAFNRKIHRCNGDIQAILDLGPHPFMKHRR